jgi:hypothetical protein
MGLFSCFLGTMMPGGGRTRKFGRSLLLGSMPLRVDMMSSAAFETSRRTTFGAFETPGCTPLGAFETPRRTTFGAFGAAGRTRFFNRSMHFYIIRNIKI